MSPMFAVLALDVPEALTLPADRIGPGPRVVADDPVEVLRGPVPRGRAETDAFVDDLARLLEGDRPVLLVHPRHRTADVLPLARLGRLVHRTARVVPVPTELPPLASGVLVDLLAGLAGRLDLDGGRAAALVPELERQLIVVGWVRSVSRLRHPEPSLRQHVLSWAARRGFEVTVRPEPSVRRLRADSAPADGVRGGPAVRAAVLAGADRHRGWLTDVLATAGASRAGLAPPHPYARDWFGTARAAELVIFPADLGALAALVGERLRIEDCAWCGLPAPAGPCAFCGAVRPEPAERPDAPLLVAPTGPLPGDPAPPAPDRADATLPEVPPGGALPGGAPWGAAVSGEVASSGALPGGAPWGAAVSGEVASSGALWDGAAPGGAAPGGAAPGGALPGGVPSDRMAWAGASPEWGAPGGAALDRGVPSGAARAGAPDAGSWDRAAPGEAAPDRVAPGGAGAAPVRLPEPEPWLALRPRPRSLPDRIGLGGRHRRTSGRPRSGS